MYVGRAPTRAHVHAPHVPTAGQPNEAVWPFYLPHRQQAAFESASVVGRRQRLMRIQCAAVDAASLGLRVALLLLLVAKQPAETIVQLASTGACQQQVLNARVGVEVQQGARRRAMAERTGQDARDPG